MRLAICGDIALWGKPEKMILGGRSNELASESIRTFLNADLAIGNIECPLTDEKKPSWHFTTLKASKAAGKFLKELGISVGSLANNHIADYGKQGLADTIDVLEDQGILWTGAGWSLEEARKPLIVEREGLRLGILALGQPEITVASRLGWGAGVLEDEYALARMASLSREVDIAIAYLHYGIEFSEYPTPHQVRLSHGLVDVGAKLVIGHHPHVPQGYEHYKDGFIAYSIGNFIFDMTDGPHKFSRLGLLVKADFEKKILKNVEIVPVDSRGGITKLLTADQKIEAEQYLKNLSEVLVDSKKLEEPYYFTCRNNFEMYVKAFFYNLFKKGNLCWVRDLIIQQLFLPQLFELRKDLVRFLLSGKALEFENSRKIKPVGLESEIWRWICRISFYLGLLFRPISSLKIKNQH